MLLNFQSQLFRIPSFQLKIDFQRVIDAWHRVAFTKIGIHNGANDLDNGTCIHIRGLSNGELCRGNFKQLCGNVRLANLIVFKG
jgi:hypothetical protein